MNIVIDINSKSENTQSDGYILARKLNQINKILIVIFEEILNRIVHSRKRLTSLEHKHSLGVVNKWPSSKMIGLSYIIYYRTGTLYLSLVLKRLKVSTLSKVWQSTTLSSFTTIRDKRNLLSTFEGKRL